jgi:transposase
MYEKGNLITKRVLQGERITDIAKEFDVTGSAIRAMVARTCRRLNRTWFEAMPSHKPRNAISLWGVDIDWLRAHKNVFFEDA